MLAVAYDTTVSARATTGVGVDSRELLAALRSRALDVHEWREPLAPSGGWPTRLGNGARPARWYSHGVHDRASREPVAVCHSTTSFGPLRRRCPIVITLHDATAVTMPYHRGPGDRAFRFLFGVRSARRADAILAPTRMAADEPDPVACAHAAATQARHRAGVVEVQGRVAEPRLALRVVEPQRLLDVHAQALGPQLDRWHELRRHLRVRLEQRVEGAPLE
jgi:hypothetical protein